MKGSPASGRSKRAWYLLLALPLLASMFPQLYAVGGPPLFGMPFFYWYQLAMSVIAGIITGIVYYATR
ncbi:MAG TPA: DUF3311 domain-containing protein [Candidatus Eremiobacteraceae bacterium]|nr:DUF3311 domain-containing protein [Candidatus Eremiobacteraceae bacterium]